MAINYEKLKNWKFEELRHEYTAKDTILYALGIGLGQDPTDENQLRFVYEDGLQALPTMAVVLAYPGFWIRNPETGVDWVKVLHGEQAFRIHKPLPPKGRVVGRMKIDEIIDKGPGKGALIYSRRDVYDAESNELLCTLEQTTFARGDGGFGGPSEGQPEPHAVPSRAPDLSVDISTRPDQALLYRLNGDRNPLHSDPESARRSGFPRPILHGLCTYGITCRAVLQAITDFDPEQIYSHQARFSAPVFPGDTITVDLWKDGKNISFEARVKDRNATVIKNGLTVLR